MSDVTKIVPCNKIDVTKFEQKPLSADARARMNAAMEKVRQQKNILFAQSRASAQKTIIPSAIK
jgi:hypothetical protein